MESIPKVKREMRNWLELPEDIIMMVLLKLGVIDILNNAQNVCSLWHKICKDPSMWRTIDISHSFNLPLEKICMNAIHRSCGGLLDISIERFCTDQFLKYITQSSKQLRRIRLVRCCYITNSGLIEAVSELPLLEHLELYLFYFSTETLGAVGRCCPLLKSFKLLNFNRNRRPDSECDDEEALAIAENMPNLHHLEICFNWLSDKGLEAILEGCPYLESLDLRGCLNLNMNGPLGSKCADGRIINLRLPRDPIDDYEFSDGSDFQYEYYDQFAEVATWTDDD